MSDSSADKSRSDSYSVSPVSDGFMRCGTAEQIARESVVQSWPESLARFAPAERKRVRQGGLICRTEENLGAPHTQPMTFIERWNDARKPFWTPRAEQRKTLLRWLKLVEPSYKIVVRDLFTAWKARSVNLPFAISKGDIRRILDRELSIVLHEGYVHRRLNPRRIRERGFLSWGGARSNGLRGTDMAPFTAPEGQPLDIQLHILKWSWKNAPERVPECLIAMGLLKPKVETTKISFTAHPSISKDQLHTILGCKPGDVSAAVAGRALARASKLRLGGEAVSISCVPAVPKRKDPAFFLPRNRNVTDLFSRWHAGVRVDEQGRYSLTPERVAMAIARDVESEMVLDAFCGCGGNTIAFARQPHIRKVIAVDQSASRLAMAEHNAKIYGVAHKIEFMHADVLGLSRVAPFVFADPPWLLGTDFLHSVSRWAYENYAAGIIKLPIDHPFSLPVHLVLTEEDYPSFALMPFSSMGKK
ncbi:MAG: methyltransferase domain-containing protein [Myxococcota bacterium]|nr:methyltransferase domain-containing protein [Myxococcota bacterium]